eukprot:14845883-Alexandrium_andersonii.AAC.1
MCCSLPMFSLANINKDKSSKYPLLNAKAAKCRILLRYLAEVTYQWLATDPSEYSRTRATCVWAINTFHHCMESSDRDFSDQEAERAIMAGRIFLLTYARLAKMSHSS